MPTDETPAKREPWLDEDGEMMDARDIERAMSLGWEGAIGADSIDTIERVYDQTPGGAYVCIYPACSFARKDSHAVWRHVHSMHGEPSLPDDDFDPGPWL